MVPLAEVPHAISSRDVRARMNDDAHPLKFCLGSGIVTRRCEVHFREL